MGTVVSARNQHPTRVETGEYSGYWQWTFTNSAFSGLSEYTMFKTLFPVLTDGSSMFNAEQQHVNFGRAYWSVVSHSGSDIVIRLTVDNLNPVSEQDNNYFDLTLYAIK